MKGIILSLILTLCAFTFADVMSRKAEVGCYGVCGDGLVIECAIETEAEYEGLVIEACPFLPTAQPANWPVFVPDVSQPKLRFPERPPAA